MSAALAFQIIGFVLAGVGAFIAYGSYRNSREAKANEIWIQYLRLAFENPSLTRQHFSEMIDVDDQEKLEWFVSIMFFAAEQIKIVSKKNLIWDRVIIDQIKYYGNYIFGIGDRYSSHLSPNVAHLRIVAKHELELEGKLREWGFGARDKQEVLNA